MGLVCLDSEGLVSRISLSNHMKYLKCTHVIKFAYCTQKSMLQCGQERGYSTPCATELTGLSSVPKPQKLP